MTWPLSLWLNQHLILFVEQQMDLKTKTIQLASVRFYVNAGPAFVARAKGELDGHLRPSWRTRGDQGGALPSSLLVPGSKSYAILWYIVGTALVISRNKLYFCPFISPLSVPLCVCLSELCLINQNALTSRNNYLKAEVVNGTYPKELFKKSSTTSKTL